MKSLCRYWNLHHGSFDPVPDSLCTYCFLAIHVLVHAHNLLSLLLSHNTVSITCLLLSVLATYQVTEGARTSGQDSDGPQVHVRRHLREALCSYYSGYRAEWVILNKQKRNLKGLTVQNNLYTSLFWCFLRAPGRPDYRHLHSIVEKIGGMFLVTHQHE